MTEERNLRKGKLLGKYTVKILLDRITGCLRKCGNK